MAIFNESGAVVDEAVISVNNISSSMQDMFNTLSELSDMYKNTDE